VLTLAPQDTCTRSCGVSSSALNDAVFEAARAELRDAEELLGDEPVNARFVTLVEGEDPPISDWATREGIARVLLPARPLRARHPAERSLRAVMGDRVLRVGP